MLQRQGVSRKANMALSYLEYDTARAGGFEPLADLPPNKSVVLGLVSSKIAKLEDPQELIAKVNEAAEIIAGGVSGGTKEEALQRYELH